MKKALEKEKFEKATDVEKGEFMYLVESLFVNLNGFKKVEDCFLKIQNAFNFSVYEGDDLPDRLILGSHKVLPATLDSFRGQVNDFFCSDFKSLKEQFKIVEKLAEKNPQILFYQLVKFDGLLASDKYKEAKTCLAAIENIDPGYWLLPIMKNFVQPETFAIIEPFDRMLNGENMSAVFGLDFEITFEEKILFYLLFFKYLTIKDETLPFEIFVKSHYSANMDSAVSIEVETTLLTLKSKWVFEQLKIDDSQF